MSLLFSLRSTVEWPRPCKPGRAQATELLLGSPSQTQNGPKEPRLCTHESLYLSCFEPKPHFLPPVRRSKCHSSFCKRNNVNFIFFYRFLFSTAFKRYPLWVLNISTSLVLAKTSSLNEIIAPPQIDSLWRNPQIRSGAVRSCQELSG